MTKTKTDRKNKVQNQSFKQEALKAFCFVSVSVLVFKKKQKQKQNRII